MCRDLVVQRRGELAVELDVLEAGQGVPAAVAGVLEAALAHDIAARTPDALSFAKKLSEAARIPMTPASGTDVTVLASPPSSPSSAGATAAPSSRSGASPPTGTGVVVGARVQLEAGLPRRRGPATWIALAAGVAGVIAVAAVLARQPAPKTPPRGGLVATAPEPSFVPSGSPSGAASTAPTTTTHLQPLGSAVQEPPASAATASPSASASSKTTTTGTADAGARPNGQAIRGIAPVPTTTKSGTSQYGAAGVSTAYREGAFEHALGPGRSRRPPDGRRGTGIRAVDPEPARRQAHRR